MSASDRQTLARLVEEANVNFTAEDVLREFRATRDTRSDRKLLKVLEIISKNQPEYKEYLAEAELNLQRKDPIYVLLVFLSHFSTDDSTLPTPSTMQAFHKKDIPTSTPLLARPNVKSENGVDTNGGHYSARSHTSELARALEVTPEEVMDIKERVLYAAGGNMTTRVSTTNAKLPSNLVRTKTNVAKTSEMPVGFRTDALWEFYKVEHNGKHLDIAAVPLASQENLLLADLIYCLSGVRGCYITPIKLEGESKGIEQYRYQFIISKQIHCSLADIAQEILPLASDYMCVQKFMQKAQDADAGQVLQALSSSLMQITHDYYLLLAQLESEQLNDTLTMHKMLFYLSPTMSTMQVIADTVADIMLNNRKGAAALTLLYNKVNTLTGDTDTQKFIIDLTVSATVPYMQILQLWIQKGIIVDPGQEFLVEDNEVIRREELPEHYSSDYWEKRYTIRRERIPCFLEKVSDIILRTGKYLNVIRQCGKKVTPSQIMKLEFTPNNQNHITIIENAYSFASKTLLEVLLKENDLMGHLMSVKRYLLLNQGDFIMQFMDACEEELAKNVDQVLPMALENLLGLTLRLSSARNDPYKDDLHCELLTYDLVTQMSKIMDQDDIDDYWQPHDRLDLCGLECFAFTYEVKWPVSLVLNHIAISKYQMLFRQLFYCKHVERQLCKIWKENSIAKRFSAEAAELYRSAFTLRQRMKNAIQNLEYYMMIEIIEPNWHTFIQKMEKVENVDEVLALHQDFLDSCLKNCMLTETTVLNRYIFKMCKLCLKFCEFIQPETLLVPSDTFAEKIKRFSLEFTGILISFLKQINEIASENTSDRFMNLVHRMNFNYFYSDEMEKL